MFHVVFQALRLVVDVHSEFASLWFTLLPWKILLEELAGTEDLFPLAACSQEGREHSGKGWALCGFDWREDRVWVTSELQSQ